MTTSPITSGDVTIFSRPGATDPHSACSRAKRAWPGRPFRAWLRGSFDRVFIAGGPAKPTCRSGASTDAMPGSLPCVLRSESSQSVRSSIGGSSRRRRAAAAPAATRALEPTGGAARLGSGRPGRRLRSLRGSPRSSSTRSRNIRQSPTVISSPWWMLPVVILWPLISTYSASGEASTLNRLGLPANPAVHRPDDLALESTTSQAELVPNKTG